ncbi:hypothetical protein [Larkinella humicola]|uniref:YD repeat-containing protein n=1 Tax=Larkinella humicola TaxID=2607654 RepID=A0A5N1J334_9BACT|nr:hypothetical protein [Larkinella humicola]KAA9340427.1 hypothetical protein F0P93_30970 [Larkinella humicola]
MKFPFTRFAIPATLLFLFGSCSVQDHLKPAFSPNPYDNVLLTNDDDLAIVAVEANSTLKVGDVHPGKLGFGTVYGKVAEIIELEGKKYALAQGGDGWIDYGYDAQRRVNLYRSKYAFTKGADLYKYAYSPGKIIQTYENEGLIAPHTSTIDLNEYGLIPENNVTYNQDGYVIERRGNNDDYTKYTILDGNVVKTETKDGTGEYITTNEFDLTKLSVPYPLSFKGKKDRNLLLKSTMTYTKIESQFSDYRTLSKEYRYVFDQAGKVALQLTITTQANGKIMLDGQVYKYK